MFSSSQQGGFISIFYSVGSNPLALWDKQVKNGHIRRVIDDEVKSLVLDIGGTNVATTYITCPIKPRASLGIRLPYLVMVIKNMKKYFSFEIQILDDKDMRRRFRVSNFQSTTKVRPFCTTMPIGLCSGWNQVQFNLADFTKRAYGSMYIEAVRVQIHANVRIRRIFFTDQLHSDEDMPNEFRLFTPGPRDQKGKGKEKKPSKEALETMKGEPVPPIKTDEEIPPPPTPAEESPIAKEEVKEEVKEEPEIKEEVVEAPADTETGLSPEGETAPITSEAPPEGVEGEVPPPQEGGEEPQTTGEGEDQPPVEGEVIVTEEGDLPPLEPEKGLEIVLEAGEAEAEEEPVAEAAATEGQEAPVEGPVSETEGEMTAEGAVETAPPEEAVQETAPTETTEEVTTMEQTETVMETTEVTTTEVTTTEVTTTEVTETSASEPATTDNEEGG